MTRGVHIVSVSVPSKSSGVISKQKFHERSDIGNSPQLCFFNSSLTLIRILVFVLNAHFWIENRFLCTRARSFEMESPCHPPVEVDAKTRYIIYKGTSRPFGCNTSSGTYGEIGRLIFPVFNLYVPALAPRNHFSETALQFVEKTTFVFLCRLNTCIVRKQIRMSSFGGIISI
jgi:hypothetical protein